MKLIRMLGQWVIGAATIVLASCGGGGDSATPSAAASPSEGPQAVAAADPTNGWTMLAYEGWPFSVSGTQTVRFGAGANWIEKTVSGAGQCTNGYFGRDPIYMTLKRCYLKTGTALSWLWLANEWQSFSVSGPRVVRFGQGSNWIQKTIDGAGWCSNEAFGNDPARGVAKRCFVQTENAGPDQAPLATISGPREGATFKAGDVISYGGLASDREDGPLTASQLVFSAELHHDTHTHPFLAPTRGAGGKVSIPVRGETSPNIFYRFTLAATDSAGHTTRTTRDILPRKSTLQFASVPPGLTLSLDGQPLATPSSVVGVVGIERDLGAADQVANGRRYRFDRWNDGGAAQHTLSTPVADTLYTATFSDVGSAVNQPPSVALSAAANGTNGSPMNLLARASDADGSIARVVFYDGSNELGTVSASPFNLSWTPSSTGRHELSARATDNDGATAVSAVVAVNISAPTPQDTQPPQAALTTPAHLAANLLNTIAIAATASDNVGVARVEFEVDGAPVGAALSAAPYRIELDTTAYASGQHVLRVRAADAAGNLSAWSSATVSFGGSRSEPRGFSRNDQWTTGLNQATSMTQAPDGRVLVTEQGGRLRVIRNGALLAEPMLQVATAAVGERGLLGVALHPNFGANGYVYVYYTSAEGGAHNRISRFVASGDKTTGVETVLVELPALSAASNHNGGAMHFGVDGKLYVGVGDNARPANAQDLTTPLGKMLRFNDDGGIPADNPFYRSSSGLARAVWAYGLRNPFTFAVEPGSGRIHINDVGQNTWEEINLGAPGANYGWPGSEGPDSLASGISGPLFSYKHSAASPAGSGPGGFFVGFCIVGGAFYPATGNFPSSYRRSYFFADFVGRFVARIDLANANAAYAFATIPTAPVDLIAGADGALYVLTRSGITRIAAL